MDAGCGYTLRIVEAFAAANAWVADSCVCTQMPLQPLAFLTAFNRTDTFVLGKELVVKTEVSIEYCVV